MSFLQYTVSFGINDMAFVFGVVREKYSILAAETVEGRETLSIRTQTTCSQMGHAVSQFVSL